MKTHLGFFVLYLQHPVENTSNKSWLTSRPLCSPLLPVFTCVSQNPFRQNPLPEVQREKEQARQIERNEKRQRERESIQHDTSDSRFLALSESWDLKDDGSFFI